MDSFDKPERCSECGRIVYPEEASSAYEGLLFCEDCSDELPTEDDNFPEAEINDYSGPCIMPAPAHEDYYSEVSCQECF